MHIADPALPWAEDICLTDGSKVPTMVVAERLPGRLATSFCEPERRRDVCPVPEPCPERSPDLSFPRSFQCGHCGVDVSLDAPGTSHRNHCPSCLWSRHLDRNVPGDRKAACPGGMEPIAVTVRGVDGDSPLHALRAAADEPNCRR